LQGKGADIGLKTKAFPSAQLALDKDFCRAYGVLVFPNGGLDIMATFELQPVKSELQQLAEQYWQKTGEKEHELEKAAFDAGAAIRKGDLSLVNLEIIVRWKSERVVHYLIGNSEEKIRKVLAVAASPASSIREAVEALTGLRGIDISVASAILATIHPDRYAVLDFRALEALGHARHDVEFYEKYLAFCRQMAESGAIKPQGDLPGPTPLHALERALWEWSRSHAEQGAPV
jgi:hypothetical protein